MTAGSDCTRGLWSVAMETHRSAGELWAQNGRRFYIKTICKVASFLFVSRYTRGIKKTCF